MIDTRNKIVPLEQLRAAGRRVVIGYFDPLLPAHVARLRELAGDGKLLVLLASPSDVYLPDRARAELAAALDFVDAVAIAGGDPVAAASRLNPSEILCEHENEVRLRQAFIEFVRERARS